jgi:hypothetical protein
MRTTAKRTGSPDRSRVGQARGLDRRAHTRNDLRKQAGVGINSADIATNTANITTNAAGIATNAAGIETDTASIATNTAAISAFRSTAENNGASQIGIWDTADNYAATDVEAALAEVYSVAAAVDTDDLRLDGTTSMTAGAPGFVGTVLLPGWSFTGDLNTGMWHPSSDTLAWSTGGTEAMRIASSQNVIIGNATDRNGELQVHGGISGRNSVTDAAEKVFTVSAESYTNAEEEVAMLYGYTRSSQNQLRIGGGDSSKNSFTAIKFYIGSAVNTLTGTETMRLTSAGLRVGGGGQPSEMIHSSGKVRADTGFAHSGNAGITQTEVFDDNGGTQHTVVVSGGIITSWTKL